MLNARMNMLMRRTWPLVLCAVGLMLGSAGCPGTTDGDSNDSSNVLPGDGTGDGSGCTADSECNDSNACTTDSCMDGNCINTAVPGCSACAQTSDCDDGNECTDDFCTQGRCTYRNNQIACDGGMCVAGRCVVDGVESGDLRGAISDADSKTKIDVTAPLTKGTKLLLESPDPTIVLLGPPESCNCIWAVSPAASATLSNPLSCTTECTLDRVGQITIRLEVTCGNTVSIYRQTLTVIEANQCVNDAGCDDNNPCTIDDCANSECRNLAIADCTTCGTDKDCDDENPCTVDVCAVQGTCLHQIAAIACDDGDECTANDMCDSNGVCAGTALDCDDDNICTTDSCDNETCKHVNNTLACDDGDNCTTDDACVDGTCTGTEPSGDAWHVVFDDLPAALLSVHTIASGDVYAVGSVPSPSDGMGAYMLHNDGSSWERLSTPVSKTLWWLDEIEPNDIWICGAERTVLRYNATTDMISSVPPPTGVDTLYGIWGASADDIWAVGGALNGVILRYDGTQWTEVDLSEKISPLPVLYKVWGRSADDVWIVGATGLALHWDGNQFEDFFTGTDQLLFTVNGDAANSVVTAVGGVQAGKVLDFSAGTFTDATPTGAVRVNGVNYGAGGQAKAVGNNATTLRRVGGTWLIEENNGLDSISDRSFHAVWVEPSGSAWAVGGDLAGIGPMGPGIMAYYGMCPPTTEIMSAAVGPDLNQSVESQEMSVVTDAKPAKAPQAKLRGVTPISTCDFANCVGGPGSDPPGSPGEQVDCLVQLDADADNDVDLRDYATAQESYELNLTGQWTLARDISTIGGEGETPMECIAPILFSDVTTASFNQVDDTVTLSVNYFSDTDSNDRVDESPGQLWISFEPTFCPDGDPFNVEFTGTLSGGTLTASANSGVVIYCGCFYQTSGDLTATVNECGEIVEGTMFVRTERLCQQFNQANCAITYDFSAVQP